MKISTGDELYEWLHFATGGKNRAAAKRRGVRPVVIVDENFEDMGLLCEAVDGEDSEELNSGAIYLKFGTRTATEHSF